MNFTQILSGAASLMILSSLSSAVLAATFHVGDKVQAWNVDWYEATIIGVGSGQFEGTYLVKWAKFSGQQYIKAENIRSIGGSATAATSPQATSVGVADRGSSIGGRYTCLGYSGGIGQFRWYLTINARTYQQSTPDIGGGSLQIDPGKDVIEFTSGPYNSNNWIGIVTRGTKGEISRVVLRDRAAEAQGPRVREYANVYCTLSRS